MAHGPTGQRVRVGWAAEETEPTSSLELLLAAPDGRTEGLIGRVLATIRELLDADVAVVAQPAARGGLLTRVVDAAPQSRRASQLRTGRRLPLDEAYLRPLLDEMAPVLIADAATDERTAGLPGTVDLAVGCFLAVPLQLPDGSLAAVLCCFGPVTDSPPSAREVRALEALGRLLVRHLVDEREEHRSHVAATRRVRALLREGMVPMAFQPIVDLRSGAPVGLEALARFGERPPAECFAEADLVGLGVELELLAASSALAAQPHLGDGLDLAVNVGPEALTSERFLELVDDARADRLIVELTEHARIDDYRPLLAAVAALRERGARLAVDDAGAGYAGLSHILTVGPDIIKLDLGLVRDVHRDPVRAALAASLVSFAGRTGAGLVAEGVETREEADALLDLGVRHGQGFLFARPGPLPAT